MHLLFDVFVAFFFARRESLTDHENKISRPRQIYAGAQRELYFEFALFATLTLKNLQCDNMNLWRIAKTMRLRI